MTRRTKCDANAIFGIFLFVSLLPRLFVTALAKFPKTLCAAVDGSCVGIGVTVLPLFDVVLASERATFETPYARAGQLPEAAAVLQLSGKVLQNAVSFMRHKNS